MAHAAFVLYRFILPILGEYSDSGYRDPKAKTIDSLRANAQYYALVFGSGVLGLIYVIVSYGKFTESLKSTVMALAYCWGLILAIYLMGHGLIAIPRRLFRSAGISGRLRRIQSQAPKTFEQMEDAELNLEDLENQVFELSKRKVGSARDFHDWIEELVDMTNLPESGPRTTLGGTGDEAPVLPTVITEKYLADLTRRLVRARHARVRFTSEWHRLLRDAVETQAILDSAASKKLDFGSASSSAGLWDKFTIFTPYTRYLFHYHLMPYTRFFLGALLALASACIVWSEVVKGLFPMLSVIRYSVIHHYHDGKGQVGFAGQVIAAFWILYMCAAALTSITEVKVWRGRALVRRNTAHESAFWYASQVARLSIPISYNFMTFLGDNLYDDTVFYGFLGRLINLTPLGEWFETLFPMFILLPVCATLFGLYGKVKRLIGFGVDVIDDDDNEEGAHYGTGSWREGRDLIDRELNGTSAAIRGRRAEAVSRLATAAPNNPNNRAAPTISVPGSSRRNGGGPSTPLGTSPNTRPQANISARRVGRPSALPVDPEDDTFFGALGHRVKNTIDTLDTPRWLQDLGQGIKKPKWMGGNDDDAGSGSNNNSGGAGADVRRWFGGNNQGRIRLG